MPEIPQEAVEAARKTCTKCGEAKPLEQFYRNSATKGGRLNSCKACQRLVDAASRQENRERRQADLRRWKEQNPEAVRRHDVTWKQHNREKALAHRTVERAVKSGKLVRPDVCESCGQAGRIEGHHTDYTKRLEVTWLCRSCHLVEHQDPVLAEAALRASSSSGEETRET